eukprot:gene38862-47990_t
MAAARLARPAAQHRRAGHHAGGGGLNLGIHVGDQPHNVARNRALLAAELPDEPLWLNQVHGVQVVDAGKVRPGQVPTADASIARVPNTVCAILTADCLPVLFCDTAGTVVGAAHAGWRGLADGAHGQHDHGDQNGPHYGLIVILRGRHVCFLRK